MIDIISPLAYYTEVSILLNIFNICPQSQVEQPEGLTIYGYA
jgi:hypothetical protein